MKGLMFRNLMIFRCIATIGRMGVRTMQKSLYF